MGDGLARSQPLPLEGVRILAVTQLGAGPYAMTVLADLGAEVIKIEDPVNGGDEARQVPPFAGDGDSLYFQALNRNARSVTLNLRTPDGLELLRRLAGKVDALYANARGDMVEKLGLDYRSLAPYNPRIVCCALSGFGTTGPLRSEPGYDYLLQALAGFMSLTGEPDGPPAKAGISFVDFSGGLMSIVGLLIGLLRARTTGQGGDVDVSLFDTALSMLNYLAAWTLNRGYRAERLADSAHPGVVPSQIFASADGHMVVMCMKEKFWLRLCERLEMPQLAQDARFRSFADRLEHRRELIGLLKPVFASQPTAEWMGRLRGYVPCAPVCSVGEALEAKQALAREMIVDVPHPKWGVLREVGCPIKIDDVRPAYRAASAAGADTSDVLIELLGMGADELAALRARGIV